MKKFLTLFITVLAVVGFSFGVVACEPVDLDDPMYEQPMPAEPVEPVN